MIFIKKDEWKIYHKRATINLQLRRHFLEIEDGLQNGSSNTEGNITKTNNWRSPTERFSMIAGFILWDSKRAKILFAQKPVNKRKLADIAIVN